MDFIFYVGVSGDEDAFRGFEAKPSNFMKRAEKERTKAWRKGKFDRADEEE